MIAAHAGATEDEIVKTASVALGEFEPRDVMHYIAGYVITKDLMERDAKNGKR